jgi:Arc/MetJ-type ribon-helix-helix transcriptional regulator
MKMQIELTPEQSSFVDLAVREGRLQRPEEAVQQAMMLWENRERARLELLSSLEIADSSIDAGEGEIYTEADLHELVKSVRDRGMARLASQ